MGLGSRASRLTRGCRKTTGGWKSWFAELTLVLEDERQRIRCLEEKVFRNTDLEALKAEATAKQAGCDEFLYRRNELQSSTFWQLTRPLRATRPGTRGAFGTWRRSPS